MTWYRGGWCPYCNIALRASQEPAGDPNRGRQPGRDLARDARQQHEHRREEPPRFRRPERPGEQGRGCLRRGLQAPRVIADQFKGRLDLAKYNGEDSGTLPLGATYVIDRRGSSASHSSTLLWQEGRARRSDLAAPQPRKRSPEPGKSARPLYFAWSREAIMKERYPGSPAVVWGSRP